jgi:hypothetical protein
MRIEGERRTLVCLVAREEPAREAAANRGVVLDNVGIWLVMDAHYRSGIKRALRELEPGVIWHSAG